jgi:hypothetical protein
MAGFANVITQLEQQKAAIVKALAALRDVEGSEIAEIPTAETQGPSKPATRQGGMTPEGKARLVAALKKRWAANKRASKKAEAPVEDVSPASSTEPAPNKRSEAQKKRWAAKNASGESEAAPAKGGMTEDGRKRLAEAMKKRWAVKRAASAVKKRGKKAA